MKTQTPPRPFNRHPAAIARDRWLESEPAKKLLDGTASGQYLQNRIEAAFAAGYAAAVSRLIEAIHDRGSKP